MISVTVLLPLVTAALLVSLPRSPAGMTHRVEYPAALLGALATLACAGALLFSFDAGIAGYQPHLLEHYEWIPSLGIAMRFGIDGISVFPVVSTALLTVLAILGSSPFIAERPRQFLVASLVLETSLLGVFTAVDAILCLVFLEVAVLSLYFILATWGRTRSRAGAVKFVVFAAASITSIFVTVLYVNAHLTGGGGASFDMVELTRGMKSGRVSPEAAWALFVAAFSGGAVLLPLFPFHTWLAGAHEEAPPPGDILVAGLLVNVGTYSLVRFALPLFPETAREAAPWLTLLAIGSTLAGALVSLVQSDPKRLIVCFSVSHVGLVLAGLLSFEVEGIVGSLVLLLNHSLAAAALFFLLGALRARQRAQRIGDDHGLAWSMPRLAVALLGVTAAAVGLLPGGGLVGTYLIVKSLLRVDATAATAAMIGVLTIAASLMSFCGKLLFFRRPQEKIDPSRASDLRRGELGVVLFLGLLMVVVGLFSSWFADRMTPTVQEWLKSFE